MIKGVIMSTGKMKVLVVSGFLGAGKTTWIKMLIDHNPVRGKLALIESDFGEVNVDGALMEGEPLSLYELTAGCICCSLRGNFRDAVRAVAAAASPELLLIEPSGVAMASDVLSALKEPEEAGLCEVKGVVTLVDGEAAPMYIHNFWMFYKDQLKEADAVFVRSCPEGQESFLQKLLAEHAKKAEFFMKDWDEKEVSAWVKGFIGEGSVEEDQTFQYLGSVTADHEHEHEHDHEHDHDHEHEHDHDHEEEVLQQSIVTVDFPDESVESFKRKLRGLMVRYSLIRAKGIIRIGGKPVLLQGTPGSLLIKGTDKEPTGLVLIGSEKTEEAAGELSGASHG